MKVKNEFLRRVMKLGSIDTQKFRYRKKSITLPDYQFAVIERVPLESLPCTSGKWELVATTQDGKTFTKP